MILAPALAVPVREQLLLIIDAAVYVALGLAAAANAPASPDGGAVFALVIFFSVSTTAAAWRHLQNARAACYQGAPAYGGVVRPPSTIPAGDPAAPASAWHAVPAYLLVTGGAAHLVAFPASRAVPLVLVTAGAFLHCGRARSHGDYRGGKAVPTYFALMLHLVSLASGLPPAAAVSLQRVLILGTYLMTGARKVYCTGFRWADGKNLQLMVRPPPWLPARKVDGARASDRPGTSFDTDQLGVQGLYHDLDGDPLAFNFAMAENRDLCFLGSAGVLVLQLLMPAFLALDAALPSRGVLHAAFWLAMSFHAGNHILWRINFFDVRRGVQPRARRARSLERSRRRGQLAGTRERARGARPRTGGHPGVRCARPDCRGAPAHARPRSRRAGALRSWCSSRRSGSSRSGSWPRPARAPSRRPRCWWSTSASASATRWTASSRSGSRRAGAS